MAQQYALPNKNNRVALQAPPRTATPAQAVPVPVVPAGGLPTAGKPTPGDPRGMTPVITALAAKYGITPEVALKVAKSEGLAQFYGDGGQSGGALQLYTGTRGGGGLGTAFQKATGLDPLDRKNEIATIDYALKHASQNGWGPWYGAAKVGVGTWDGISGKAAEAVPLDPTPNVGSGERDYANTITAKTGDDGEKDDKKKKKSKSEAYGDAAGEGLEAIGKSYAAARNTGASGPTTVPAASLPTPMGPISMVDPKMIEMQRQQLAMAMQRLNSGKLV